MRPVDTSDSGRSGSGRSGICALLDGKEVHKQTAFELNVQYKRMALREPRSYNVRPEISWKLLGL